MKKSFKVFSFFSAFLFTVLMMSSCKDDACKAGGGGSLTLMLSPKHHVRPIPGCTIKIKFNAKDFPGVDGAYDLITQADPNATSVTVTGLNCGEYYIFGIGTDTTLSDIDKTVKGGIPFSTEQESGTIELDIPVTEVH